MDSNQNSSPSSGSGQEKPDFVKKTIEQPMLDSALREKLSSNEAVVPEKAVPPSGLKAFYKSNKIYLWGIILGLAVISVLAFFAFRKSPAPVVKEAKVDMSIQAPETVASGGEVVYKIKVENQDSQKLVGIQLELAYPGGLSYLSSSPKAENISGTVFDVPDLIPGQNAVVIVKAKATGNINDTKKLAAKLHYKYANFNSEFVKDSDFTVRLAASDVTLEIQGPGNTNNAQLIVYNIKYKNNSEDDIKNARVQVTYPQGFSFAAANPNSDMGNNIWNVSSLPKGNEGAIQVQGTFNSASPGESKTAKVEFMVLGPNGDFFTQADSEFITTIANLPLLVSQELDNQDKTSVVKPGDTLLFKIRYQNNASTVATGVNILATLDSRSLDLSTLQTEGGQVNGNTILWNASTVSKLENLSPSESGELSFTVQIRNPATKDSTRRLTVVSNIKIKSNEYEAYFPGNSLELKISSPASVAGMVKQVNGPVPPQVGKITTYKVSLSLSNSSNDFSDGVLTAFIPLGPGGFVDKSFNVLEGNKAEYDPATGKLTWNFGALSAYAGKFGQARTLEFSVKLNPSSSQVGQSPTLVKDIKFTAKDTFTGQDVQGSMDDLTTSDLPGDYGYSLGQVMQ